MFYFSRLEDIRVEYVWKKESWFNNQSKNMGTYVKQHSLKICNIGCCQCVGKDSKVPIRILKCVIEDSFSFKSVKKNTASISVIGKWPQLHERILTLVMWWCVVVSFLLLWQTTMSKATYRRAFGFWFQIITVHNGGVKKELQAYIFIHTVWIERSLGMVESSETSVPIPSGISLPTRPDHAT